MLKDGDLCVEPEAYIAKMGGSPVDLTPHEFAVLTVLMENRGRVITRSRLAELAMGLDYDGLNRTVDV